MKPLTYWNCLLPKKLKHYFWFYDAQMQTCLQRTIALPTPPVVVPASPWMWVKARSKLGALIRLCGDGAVSNEARMFFCRIS
jgi:hypothetical protein